MYQVQAANPHSDGRSNSGANVKSPSVPNIPDDPIFVVDENGCVCFFNQAAQDLFGLGISEINGEEITQCLATETDRQNFRGILSDIAGAETQIFPRRKTIVTAQNKDGKKLLVSVNLSRYFLDSSVYIVGLVKDMTPELDSRDLSQPDQFELEKSLNLASEELRRFVHMVSYDLKEPLRMVSSYLELLERTMRGSLDEKSDKYIHYAADGAQRMKTMIDDVVAYSRVYTHGQRFTDIEANQVVDHALAELRSFLQSNNASVFVGVLPRISVDPMQMVSVFRHLITNAVKFNESESPRVMVSARWEHGAWIFAVEDNGIGLDARFHQKIFEVSRRLNGTGEHSGSGLGLATTRKIIERHGGEIWVRSSLGSGSTFYFALQKVKLGVGLG